MCVCVCIYIKLLFSPSQNTFKILLVGDSGVGKTCFLLKFTDVLNPPTLSGVDFKVRTVEVDDVSVTLQIVSPYYVMK